MSILDHPDVGGRYFFPRRAPLTPQLTVSVDGADLACFQHDIGAETTLVHFHGNGEIVADYLVERDLGFFDLGINLVFVEYRGYGGSTGTPGLVKMLGDGVEVLDALGCDPSRVIAFGRSIGSLFAVELAHRVPDLGGLVLESGIADVAQRLLVYADLPAAGITERQLREEVNRHLNQQQKLSEYQNPLLLLHTEHDSLVDISHAERNYAAAGSPDKQFSRFAAGDHNSIMHVNFREYFNQVRGLLERSM